MQNFLRCGEIPRNYVPSAKINLHISKNLKLNVALVWLKHHHFRSADENSTKMRLKILMMIVLITDNGNNDALLHEKMNK